MRGKKKVKLSPLVNEILSFPDETGLVSLPRLLNHLQGIYNDVPPVRLLGQVDKAIRTCSRLGYLYLKLLSSRREMTVPVWEWRRPTLATFIGWDEAGRCWVVYEGKQQIEDLVIQLTKGGVNDLTLYRQQRLRS